MATVASVSPVAAMQSLHTVGSRAASARRRRISPEAGRAIEMLGHAIEYLADEFALECRTRGVAQARKHGTVVAIELLMEKNREVYFSCPVVPTISERLRSILRLQKA
ncbi:MAG TPA: hypothetical protein VIM62_04445 [Acidobacteriaceae bacterium]